jgi:hypothetical protein
MIWSGSYQDRFESFNFRYKGAIEGMSATNLVLEDNSVSGSERLAYHVSGFDCDVSSGITWTGNRAHSSLIGVGVFPGDKISGNCRHFSNFTIWRCSDYGVYYNTGPSAVLTDLVLIENGVGVFPMIVGPGSVSHTLHNKTARIQRTLVVGTTSAFDCVTDAVDRADHNIQLSGQGRSWAGGVHGRVGISWPSFTAGSNKAPEKPFFGVMSYPSINGLQTIEGNRDEICSFSFCVGIITIIINNSNTIIIITNNYWHHHHYNRHYQLQHQQHEHYHHYQQHYH